MDMNRQCGTCHAPAEMTAAHGIWLPQADLHLEALPCISCHTGSKNYVINLFISKRQIAGDRDIPARGEAVRTGHLRRTETPGRGSGYCRTHRYQRQRADLPGRTAPLQRQPGAMRDLRLKGMLTPEIVTHDLQILDNRWDCTFCHASGAEAMQTSFICPARGRRHLPAAAGGKGRHSRCPQRHSRLLHDGSDAQRLDEPDRAGHPRRRAGDAGGAWVPALSHPQKPALKGDEP